MADQFSEEYVADVKRVFQHFDEHSVGYIKSYQLGKLMRTLGLNPTEKELLVFIKEIVPERDGTVNVDFPEFLTFMGRQMKNVKDVEELREAFRIFDKDGTGYISEKELYHIITHLGEPLSKKQVEEMMVDADSDEEGKVNYEDFVTLITSGNK